MEFYENVPDLDVVLPQDATQVPDIFVYVYEDVPGDDKRIGYLRYTVIAHFIHSLFALLSFYFFLFYIFFLNLN